ncbi:MAG: bifunctional diaminohydroxyphosphoribosylaminopyrimidine deaminase/5-amino-6-(5-phosphoribosylamino)uracil reductase RibD, partial [Emcibacteraceae bacterium]|nr:bifunctional diaminohydroxyphosphoribosylaminopyrimidine deaminase/5-amino-6-(5-phosphoribosylamino)uracil reductase RibD [Emcibacteraceae bacterium]
GKGIAILENAGIEVLQGLMKEEADFINQGFFQSITENKPLVTIKLATSQDGKIAVKEGVQTWVTGPEARMRGHLYRANYDAIMVGINTVLVDDPSLNCRIAGLGDRSPIRVILDSDLRIPLQSNLCDVSSQQTWIMTNSEDKEKTLFLEAKGLKVMHVSRIKDGGLNLIEVLAKLAKEGITRLLSEGGGKVNASLMKAGLIDRIIWFKSSESIGTKGVNALYDIPIEDFSQNIALSIIDEGKVGTDYWQEFNVRR